jgi:chorismate lyase
MRSWLTEPGLLTERMRRECGTAFRLNVIDESLSSTEFRRAIELLVDDRAWIYAETTVPAATLQQHDWLRRLGTRPLGEWLRDRPDITREDLEFCRVYDDDAQVARALSRAQIDSQPLWVRRTRLAVAGAPFVLHELYFPYIGLRTAATRAAAS